MTIRKLNTIDSLGNLINLTGAAADRLLLPGQTAYIDYSAATSVPLHIQTVEGLYEMDIFSDLNGSTYTGGDSTIWLTPNAGGLAAGDIDYQSITYTNASISATSDVTTVNKFVLSANLNMKIKAEISTITKNKSVYSKSSAKTAASTYSIYQWDNLWTEYTVPWTSLGTITLPFAQSGKIIIRRIA